MAATKHRPIAHPALIRWCLLSSALTLLSNSNARALSLAPMQLEHQRGQLQVSNRSDRLIRVNLQVFPPRQVNGRTTAAATPLSTEEAEQRIQLRPTSFRLGPGASRVITYRVTPDQQPFYLCGTSLQNLLQVRICSSWQPAALPLNTP